MNYKEQVVRISIWIGFLSVVLEQVILAASGVSVPAPVKCTEIFVCPPEIALPHASAEIPPGAKIYAGERKLIFSKPAADTYDKAFGCHYEFKVGEDKYGFDLTLDGPSKYKACSLMVSKKDQICCW